MEGLQARKTALEAQLEGMKRPEPLLHPGMAPVYRKEVAELASALDSADVEERESARTAIRVLLTAIVIPEGDAKLRVEGNLGEMLAIAASGRIRSTLAAVAKSGCGGLQPSEFGVCVGGRVALLCKPHFGKAHTPGCGLLIEKRGNSVSLRTHRAAATQDGLITKDRADGNPLERRAGSELQIHIRLIAGDR